MRVALAQMNPGNNVKINLEKAVNAIRAAAQDKAQIVCLPELFHYRGDTRKYNTYAETDRGPIVTLFRHLARSLNIMLVLGSILEKSPNSRKPYDTTYVISNDGVILARYRKIHMFEVVLGKMRIKESKWLAPGKSSESFSAFDNLFGLGVCFDIRYPKLFADLRKRGVCGFFIPSNFTHATGAAHWHALLRARAIETQSYIFAPNCCGIDPSTHVQSYGHSVIIDPWGEIIAEKKSGEGLLVVDVDLRSVLKVRSRLPMGSE